MNIKALLDLTCQTVANMIKGARTVFTPHVKTTVRLRIASADRLTRRQNPGGDPQDVQHQE